METSEFKKILLIKLYIKALLKTPFLDKEDTKAKREHKNSLNNLKNLLIKRPDNANVFECFNKQTEEEYINLNIKIYNAYKPYNEIINNIDIDEINLEEVYSKMNKEKDKKVTDITYEEMLELTYDFYNSLPDKEIRKTFNNIYKEKDNNIRLYDSSSFTYLLPSINYSLISLDIANETYRNMIYDLVHEYGHCIQTNLTNRIDFYDIEYEPVELMPVFLEMLSTFYFDDSKTSNTLEKNIFQQQTKIFIDQIKYTEEIMQNGYEAFKDKYNDIAQELYLEHNLLEVYSYLIPMLTSYELLTKYKEDPEKAMTILKKLVNKGDYLNKLNKNNINLGENFKEVIKILKKEEAK